MKRICCFCETWESGGIESVLTNLLLHMDRSDLEIDIVAACLKESVFTPKLKVLGIRFHELSGNLYSLIQNCSLFRKLVQQRHYDVIHLNAFQSLSFFYLLLAKQAGIPKRIAHSHNTALRKSKGRILKLWIHKLSRFFLTRYATDLWACSSNAAEFLFSPIFLKKRGYQFIPNGIDTERFRFDPKIREQIRNEMHCEEKLIIGNVGRLCYQKNQMFLLEIFTKIYKEKPDSVLLLVGGGEDRPMLEEKAEQLGVEDAVIFYGTCEQVERLYWAMDVFVFPSRFEGLPVAAIEAQAAGLTIVGTDIVVQDAGVTDSVVSLSLLDKASVWANVVLKRDKPDRPSAVKKIQEAGFDIIDCAQKVRNEWMR